MTKYQGGIDIINNIDLQKEETMDKINKLKPTTFNNKQLLNAFMENKMQDTRASLVKPGWHDGHMTVNLLDIQAQRLNTNTTLSLNEELNLLNAIENMGGRFEKDEISPILNILKRQNIQITEIKFNIEYLRRVSDQKAIITINHNGNVEIDAKKRILEDDIDKKTVKKIKKHIIESLNYNMIS